MVGKRKKPDAPQGTLDLLVLKTLSREPQHGYSVAARIQQITDDALRVEEGSLYPALIRMKRRGWLKTEWRVTEHNRRARYYELTGAGRRQLEVERASWVKASTAINGIMSGQWALGDL